jgi:Holliday junction resolvase RusA-like endonuclease
VRDEDHAAAGGMIMETTITLPFPTSLNANSKKFKGARMSEAYRNWRDAARIELLAQRPKRISGPVTVEIILVAPDRRIRDGDNLVKPVLDLLKRHLIDEDNNRIVKKHSAEWVEHGPACTVTVRSVRNV